MDPNYAMAKFGLESKNILKTKHRGCWYYTKYFFFFLSIIQFLIILGLVLFMLYGNAHVTTEQRLESLQSRYENLSHDYTLLSSNYTMMKKKLTSTEKEYGNCTNLLTMMVRQLQSQNRSTARTIVPMPPFQEVCRVYQTALERLNTTCTIESLQLKHQLFKLQRDYDALKGSCDQTMATLSSRVDQTVSEKVKLQNEKEDLESQGKLLQTVCTNINQRFETELDRMKNRMDSLVSANEPFQYSKCWSISNDIKNNIDQTITRLKQDVNNVMFENSQLKTDIARVNGNFQKCNQDKTSIISEKTQLSIEKGGLEKQLSEKKEELANSYTKFIKKDEELEACRKIQTAGRMPVGHFPRT